MHNIAIEVKTTNKTKRAEKTTHKIHYEIESTDKARRSEENNA